jgi:hypothetical protein
MSPRWGRDWRLVGAVALLGTIVPSVALTAEVPPAPPAASAQARLPCTASADLAPRRSAVHIGNFDVHFNVAAGAGQPLHVGFRLSLAQPLKRAEKRGEIPALNARGTSCGVGRGGVPRPFGLEAP